MIARIRKLVSKMSQKAEHPCPPMRPGQPYDVLLSVWNVFRNKEQRRGFEGNGLRVHWVGNQFPIPLRGEVSKRSFGWTSFISFYGLVVISSWAGFVHLSMYAFDFFSGTRRLNAKLVWAYVEMNTLLIRRAKRRGIPIVLDNPIAHMACYREILGDEFRSLGMNFHPWFIDRWVRLAEIEYRHADWFHVGSQFVKKTLVAHGIPAERILVNHTGVDLAHWGQCHNRRRSDDDVITFVYTGALIPRKGVHYLVKAWAAANLERARLVICGGGKMPWDRIVGKMPKTITFMGSVKHDRLQEIYASADAYVLPSLLEGFARSGLEAMAAGLPLIITEETGLTDVLDDGVEGWVVPSRDVEALADRLRWCCSHRTEVEAAGQKAFERMRGQDFAAYGDRCAAIAQAIIDGRSPRDVPGVC